MFVFDSLAWELIKDYLIGDKHMRYWFAMIHKQRLTNKSKVHPFITIHNKFVESLEEDPHYYGCGQLRIVNYNGAMLRRNLMLLRDELAARGKRGRYTEKRYVLKKKKINNLNSTGVLQCWGVDLRFRDYVYVTYTDFGLR